MKPERTRHRWKSVGIARARMFLKAHLEWLDGFPVAQSPGRVEWMTRPRIGASVGKSIVVDRELLHRSAAAVTSLTRHFPEAMPRLVRDVSTWSLNVTTVLERLKFAVHRNADVVDFNAAPVDSLSKRQKPLIEQLLKRHPALRELMRIVLWSGSTSPDIRDFLIQWLAENAEWIGRSLDNAGFDRGTTVILLVCDLVRQDGDDSVRFLKLVLEDAAIFQTCTSGLDDKTKSFLKGLRDWKDPKSLPPDPNHSPVDSFGEQVVSLLNWLSDQDRPVRQRAIQLASQVLSIPLVQGWRTAWMRYLTSARRAVRSLCQFAKQRPGCDFRHESRRVAADLEKELRDEPLRFPVHDLLNRIKQLAVERSPQFHAALAGFITAVPAETACGNLNRDGCALRLALVSEAAQMDREQSAIRYYELARKFFLNRKHQSFRMRPWKGLIDAWIRNLGTSWSPYTVLCRELPQLHRYEQFFSVLSLIAGQSTFVEPDCNRSLQTSLDAADIAPNQQRLAAFYTHQRNALIAWLLNASTSIEQVCERFIQLASTSLLIDCTSDQLLTAAALETEDLSFFESLHLIGSANAIEDSCLPAVRHLHGKFVSAGWPTMIPFLLRMKRSADLARVAMQFQASESCGKRLDVIPKPASFVTPAWAEDLPAALHSSIAIFHGVFPESRQRIERILGKQFPVLQKLRTEIAALTDRATQSGPLPVKMQRRLENLCNRLHQSNSPSEAAIIGMQQKLNEALLTDLFRDAAVEIESSLIHVLGGSTSIRPFAHSEIPLHHLQLVQEILKLDEPLRTYGLKLLRKRWGNVPWDLKQEQPNRQFLEKLAERGIRTEEWLSSRECQILVNGQDAPWKLAFETDEVEQLLMGYYFSTCLSPGDINFFSAVSNAIDINKRVLYARDSRGKVMGRCLIAIGNMGGIVTFRPYCHLNEANFPEHVARFAHALAADMETVVLNEDRVSELVAPDWYNDGAYDLGNSISAESSAVRLAIKTASEQTLMESLQQALSPVGLTSAMLELVIRLPEFKARPRLIGPLLPLIEQHESNLRMGTLACVAQLAHGAGLYEITARLLDSRSCEWMVRELNRHGDYDSRAGKTLRLLIEYRPSAALRVLRATRSRSVRRDADESESERRTLLAACFDALGREQLATQMRCGPLGAGARSFR